MLFARIRRTSLLALGLCLLTGCGGSNSGMQPGTTATLGPAVLTYFGQFKPQISASSGYVTVSAISGASITGVTLYPPAALQNTYIFFSRSVGGLSEIYRVPYTGGPEQLLTHSEAQVMDPAPAANGTVFYTGYTGEVSAEMSYDGTHGASFSPGYSFFLNPSVSPNEARIAFSTSGARLATCSTAGDSETSISGAADQGLGCSWAPTSASIAYIQQNASSYDNVYTIPSAGGTPTDVSPGPLVNAGNFFWPSWSSDGVSVAAAYVPSGGSNSEVLVFTTNTFYQTFATLTPSGKSDSYPSFSPDGSKVAFYRSSAGGANPGIYVCDYNGSNSELLLPDQTGDGVISSLTWSPFPSAEKVIGTGGHFYAKNASGFLYSQVGPQFGSIVAFTTTTPSTATIQTPAQTTGAQPLSFVITGDNITSLGYSNSYFSTGLTYTFTGTNPDAVVNIDATTGQVDTFALAAAKPALTSSAGQLTYSGRFNAVYDKTGKNLAPSGASQVVIDAKSGHLLSFR